MNWFELQNYAKVRQIELLRLAGRAGRDRELIGWPANAPEFTGPDDHRCEARQMHPRRCAPEPRRGRTVPRIGRIARSLARRAVRLLGLADWSEQA